MYKKSIDTCIIKKKSFYYQIIISRSNITMNNRVVVSKFFEMNSRVAYI